MMLRTRLFLAVSLTALASLTVIRFSFGATNARTVVEADDQRIEWRNGVPVMNGATFSGQMLQHDSAGTLIANISWKNGKRHGVSLAWYPNGQLHEERSYANGLEHGAHRGWWENGNPSFVATYHSARREGEMREWNSSGMLFHLSHYQRGAESGIQQMWNEDGSLRANYVVRDGRRYGFMGATGCTGSDTTAVDPNKTVGKVRE